MNRHREFVPDTRHLQITIFDTAVCSRNAGDHIIMESVDREVGRLFPNSFITKVPSHEYLGKASYQLLHAADLIIVGGTNLLSSNMNRYNQWKIRITDVFKLNKVLLLGVGWWQYQRAPNLYTRLMLNKVLDRNAYHSVRDEYSLRQLKGCGIDNVINTSCVTLWDAPEDLNLKVPRSKGRDVLFTLTDYNQKPERDSELLSLLAKNYHTLYFWPQGARDFRYFNSINGGELHHRVEVVAPSLTALKQLLDSSVDLDYIGTRLHAGIYSLMHRRRSMVIAIDNRAQEIARDTNLPCVPRDDIAATERLLNSDWQTKLTIPRDNINTWRMQFRERLTPPE